MGAGPIVAAYDGSEQAEAALRWALDEGIRRDSPVVIAYVLTPESAWPGQQPGSGNGRRSQAMSAVDRIATTASDWGLLGIEVTGSVLDGPIAHALCEQSRRASMIVMGVRGLGGFAGLPIGSVSLNVAAHAHCSVVVVRGEVRRPDRRPVAVGVDGSPEGRRAFGMAMKEAALRGVGLVAVRGCGSARPPWYGAGKPAHSHDERAGSEYHLVDDVISGWTQRYPSVAVTTKAARVTATHALTVASRDAQLMVVGARGTGGLAAMALGSVSQQLLHHSLCSLMVVRGVTDTATPAESANIRPAATWRTGPGEGSTP